MHEEKSQIYVNNAFEIFITICRLKQFFPCHVQRTFMHVQCQEKFVANQLPGSFTWFICECFINFAWLQMFSWNQDLITGNGEKGYWECAPKKEIFVNQFHLVFLYQTRQLVFSKCNKSFAYDYKFVNW